ncbi:MAG: hypothetical protein PVI30_25015 [Myxococcales bacterium]
MGSLSWDTNQDSLRAAFERFGSLDDVAVIADRETGRSRGFGFVTFAEPNDARTAQQEMDGTTLDGRSIVVNEAHGRRDGGGRRGGDRY